MLLVEQGGDNGVQSHRLALSRGTGHQQVGHFRKIEDVVLVLDRAADHHRQFGLRLLEFHRAHGRIHRHDLLVAVGHLDTDGPLAGDRCDNADTQRFEALRNVVLQILDTRNLDPLGLYDLVERHRGTRRGLDALNGDTEIFERLLDARLVLVNLLVGHLRVGEVIFEQRDRRTAVIDQILQRVVGFGRDPVFVQQRIVVLLDGHHHPFGRIAGRRGRTRILHRERFVVVQERILLRIGILRPCRSIGRHRTARIVRAVRKVDLDEFVLLARQPRRQRRCVRTLRLFRAERMLLERIVVRDTVAGIVVVDGLHAARNGSHAHRVHDERIVLLAVGRDRGLRPTGSRADGPLPLRLLLRDGRGRRGRPHFAHVALRRRRLLVVLLFPGTGDDERLQRRHLLRHRSHQLAALVDEHVAGAVDRIDEIAVDEDARQNPAAQQHDEAPHHTDASAQQASHFDAAGAAPAAVEHSPPVVEGDAERQRPQDQHQQRAEHRVVEKDGPPAQDARAHHRHDDRDNDPEQTERTADKHLGRPCAQTAAGVVDRIVEIGILAADAVQRAVIAAPVEVVEDHRRHQKDSGKEQQQAENPPRALAVGARCGGLCRFGLGRCHVSVRLSIQK